MALVINHNLSSLTAQSEPVEHRSLFGQSLRTSVFCLRVNSAADDA